MAYSGPIVLVEDDVDDLEVLRDALKELGIANEVVAFESPEKAMAYLCEDGNSPFIILCDINLPGTTGLEFKKEIDADPGLREKSIPFVFYSTTAQKNAVQEAYLSLTVQGFFQKGNTYQEVKDTIRVIVDYWKRCKHPRG